MVQFTSFFSFLASLHFRFLMASVSAMKNKYFTRVLIISVLFLEVFIGISSAIFPWYYLVPGALFFFLSVFFLIEYKFGTYLLIFLVCILGNYVGFSLDSLDFPGVTFRNVIPLYTPLYFFLAFTFVIHKIAHLGPDLKVKNPLNIPLYLLLSYSIFTLIFSPTGYHLTVCFILYLNIGIYYFIVHVVNDRVFHRRLMWCWVVGGNILAILVTISILVHPQILYSPTIIEGVNFVLNYAPRVAIRGYAIGHPNQTALLLNMAFSVMLGMFIYETNMIKRLFLLMSLIFCLFAYFLTMSKAGLGALWAMVHFLILFSSRLRKHWLRNVVLFNVSLVILFVMSYIFTNQVAPRILKVSEKGGYATSFENRIEIWKAGLDALEEKDLVPFGLGAGGFDLYTQFPHAHSLYLSFFFDFGIVGIICILLILLILFRELFLKELRGGMLWVQKTYLETMSLAFLGGLIAIGIHGTVDHTYIKDSLWLYLGFAIATLSLSRMERSKVSETDASYHHVATL